jgi:hypothetical protein
MTVPRLSLLKLLEPCMKRECQIFFYSLLLNSQGEALTVY